MFLYLKDHPIHFVLTFRKLRKLATLFCMAILCSCQSEIDVDLFLKNKLKNSNPTNSNNQILIFPIPKLSILAGDTFNITTTNGLGPYTANSLSIGNFDATATTYTAPNSLAPSSFNITLSDTIGMSGDLPVSIIGLKEKMLLDQTLSYGDQNYPMGVTQTADGNLYASSVIIDGSGWEGLATWKSSNNGATWTMVDRYFMYLAGETHPMELATKGNDVYVCGYTWGHGNTPSTANAEWLIRKSSDGGTTWLNFDHWWLTANDNICMTITVANSGDIFTAGFSVSPTFTNDTIVKTSIDNGASWQVIGNFPGAGRATSIRSSPNGDLWLVVANKFYKGTYTLGSWNWSAPVNISASTFSTVAYQKEGQLTVESNTTAYFTARVSSFWKIYRTTDGGSTWNEIHSRAGEGVSTIILGTGEIISNGNRYVSWTEGYNQIIKSTDGGSNFSLTLNKGAVGNREEGGYLYELQNGDLISLGTRYTDNQIVVMTSSDKGSNWTEASIIYYFDKLYSEVTDYAEDSAGNLYTAGWVDSTVPGDRTEPYIIMKSSNNGTTWTQSDFILDSGFDHYSDQIAINQLDHIFALDLSYSRAETRLRMSSNAGVSWNTVDTLAGSIGSQILEVDSTGYVYYLTGSILRRGSPTGSGFIDAFTFPINGGQTNFSVRSFLGTKDGPILIGTTATEAATNYAIVYKSLDQGITWTELYRAPASLGQSIMINEAANGDLYLAYSDQIYKSTNNGVSWNQIYNTTLGLGDVDGIVTSNDSQIFFTNGDDIFYYSTNSSSWKTFWRISVAITPEIDSYLTNLFKCKYSSIGVCASVVDYTKGKGSSSYLWVAE